MSRASEITAQLASLDRDQVAAMVPQDRRLLVAQLERVHRIATTEETISAAREATRAEFINELRDGRGRE
jgi:hypothetical protein